MLGRSLSATVVPGLSPDRARPPFAGNARNSDGEIAIALFSTAFFRISYLLPGLPLLKPNPRLFPCPSEKIGYRLATLCVRGGTYVRTRNAHGPCLVAESGGNPRFREIVVFHRDEGNEMVCDAMGKIRQDSREDSLGDSLGDSVGDSAFIFRVAPVRIGRHGRRVNPYSFNAIGRRERGRVGRLFSRELKFRECWKFSISRGPSVSSRWPLETEVGEGRSKAGRLGRSGESDP